MANQVEITITADPSNAEAGIKKVKTGFQSVKDSIIKNRKAIGLGRVAMGAGGRPGGVFERTMRKKGPAGRSSK